MKHLFLASRTMDAAGEILAASMPRPSSHKAKALLGQPERSFEEGSTTDGCKHGTLGLSGASYRLRRRLQYQKAVAESSSKSYRSLPP